MYNEFIFQRLDNAGIIFPAISNNNASNVYRVSAYLKEDVDKAVLEEATIKTLDLIPSYNLRIKKGLFWCYLEHNNQNPIVEEENLPPCVPINKHKNRNFLFRTTYYKNKISLEVFHVLGDATGAMFFLKTLVSNYIIIKHTGEITFNEKDFDCTVSSNELLEDGFKTYSRLNQEKTNPLSYETYHVKGVRLPGYQQDIITAIMPTDTLLNLSRETKTSITGYLSALLIWAIYNENYHYHPSEKPVEVCLPVNLRNYYKSKTTRNFFTYINIGLKFEDRQYTFEEILEIVKHQMEEKLNKEYLIKKVNFNVSTQKNMFLRIVPLFIKNIALKILYKKGEKGYTFVLSNMGKVTLPSPIASFIDRFEFVLSASAFHNIKAGLCSFENKMAFSFTTSIYERDIERFVLRFLAQKGVDIEIMTNEVGPDEVLQ